MSNAGAENKNEWRPFKNSKWVMSWIRSSWIVLFTLLNFFDPTRQKAEVTMMMMTARD